MFSYTALGRAEEKGVRPEQTRKLEVTEGGVRVEVEGKG